jgi:hypothetical protein
MMLAPWIVALIATFIAAPVAIASFASQRRERGVVALRRVALPARRLNTQRPHAA